jgi:AcrR family transcriptional regulator
MPRPRGFDAELALEAALCVFWRRGYQGSTYGELAAATGLARPGLHRVFGNKEDLFFKALDRYDARYMMFVGDALAKPTAFEVVEHLLRGAAKNMTFDDNHPGCLNLNTALTGSPDTEPVRREILRRRNQLEATIAQRLDEARGAGDLPASADCTTLAAFVMAITHGMAAQATAGAGLKTLESVVDAVLASWPPVGMTRAD